ncbi:MAG: TetR family transcriptional regulator [Candidatus Methanoplasma sp.]|jgi:AcrR family transcriptional regulator|nr:TetR family transcriptional regulator [Candidatus Methanoplasma sp.]
MRSDDKIQEIVHKTAELMLSAENREITTRRIAENANVNSAMINYYFGSKENLLKKSLLMIGGISDRVHTPGGGSRKEMFDFLVRICETSMLFRKYGLSEDTKHFAKDVFAVSSELAEMMGMHGIRPSEASKLSAYAAVNFLMTASADPRGFMEYSGIDITSKNRLRTLISGQLDTLLGDVL